MHKQHQRVSVMLKRLALTVCASTLLSVSALAQQPFTYQGFLRVNGLPANGEFDFRFRLFDSATGTNQVGTTVTVDDKQVRQGFYTVVLDFGNVWAGGQRWLEIAIRPGNQTGSFTTLSPRVQLTPVPLAHQAFSVPWSGISGIPAGFADGIDNDTTYSAGAGLSLSGTTFSIAAGGVTTGMLADGAVTSAKLSTTGVTAGTYGSATQVGVFTVDAQGRITSASNVTISGVSPGGAAGGDLSGSYPNPTVARIQGRAVATTAPSTGQVLKWDGSAWTPAADSDTSYWIAIGNNIYNSNTGNVGIGTSNPSRKLHVEGTALISFDSSPEQPTLRLLESNDSDGYPRLEFRNPTGLSNGRWWHLAGRQLANRADESFNISNAGTNVLLCYGDGRVRIPGRLEVQGTKSFYIDHPLDPENYYLVHYCSESAEPHVYYSGTVVLDASGEAWVQLPHYFEAIALDPRYTLTPVGAPMPNLHVAVEVQGNRFKIAGGVPGKRVSWRVEAIRNDPYIRHHKYQDEVAKPDHERGKYLSPELYGQPRERAVDYDEETTRRAAPSRSAMP